MGNDNEFLEEVSTYIDELVSSVTADFNRKETDNNIKVFEIENDCNHFRFQMKQLAEKIIKRKLSVIIVE